MNSSPSARRWWETRHLTAGTSYRANALGQADRRLKPHAVYRSLGQHDQEKQAAYQDLFRAELERPAIKDIRLALNQHQPLGNEWFYAKIAKTAKGAYRSYSNTGLTGALVARL